MGGMTGMNPRTQTKNPPRIHAEIRSELHVSTLSIISTTATRDIGDREGDVYRACVSRVDLCNPWLFAGQRPFLGEYREWIRGYGAPRRPHPWSQPPLINAVLAVLAVAGRRRSSLPPHWRERTPRSTQSDPQRSANQSHRQHTDAASFVDSTAQINRQIPDESRCDCVLDNPHSRPGAR